jgi:hypothetical protein
VIGDLLYASASNALAALAGNTTTTRQFLTSTGTGSAAQAPAWAALAASDIPAGIDAAKIGGGTISSAEFACLEGATSPLQAQLDTATTGAAAQFSAIGTSLNNKSDVGHTHDAAAIVTGTVAPVRLGSGTPTSSTLLDGSGAWRGLAASDVPSLDASKITSGTLDVARLNGGNSTQFVRADGTYSNTLTGFLTASGLNLDTNGIGTGNSRQIVGHSTVGVIYHAPTGQRHEFRSNNGVLGYFQTDYAYLYGTSGVMDLCGNTRISGGGISLASGAGNGSLILGSGDISIGSGRVILGNSASIPTGSNAILGTSLGTTINSTAGMSNRLQVAGTVVANLGASEGTVGVDRFALGRYASGSIDGTKSGVSSNGTNMVYNADGTLGHYFFSAGASNVRIQSGVTRFFAPTGLDYSVRVISKSYYPSITLETDATSPAGSGTWGSILGYAGMGCYIYGNPSLVLFSGAGEGLRISNSTIQCARNLSFTSGFGVPEEALRSYNGGPNLANESLKQLRNGTIFSRAVNTGAAVQSRVNSVEIPGGAAIVYSGTGSQPSIYLGESLLPVDTTKTYSLRGWLANTVNTTQQSYIGLLCYNSAGGILSYIYPAASAVVAPSGGQWYQGYVSGTVFPAGFPAGTQYVRTATMVGYGSPSGAWTTQTSPIEFIECPAQCGVFHNTTQSVADTTWTVAVFNSELVDTSGLHDTTLEDRRDRVNVPRTGKYRITAQAEFAGNATGYRQARITVNGSALARSTKIVPNNGASLEAQAGIEIYALLTAGDIVRLEAYQDSGGSLDLTSNTRLYLLWISD